MAHETKCSDTVEILDEWKETLTVWRLTTASYNAAKLAVETWTSVGTFLGDWQPASGSTMRNEAGLSVKSEAVVIAPCNANVLVNDKLYKDDGTWWYVTYIWEFEEHKTVHLKKTEGAN